MRPSLSLFYAFPLTRHAVHVGSDDYSYIEPSVSMQGVVLCLLEILPQFVYPPALGGLFCFASGNGTPLFHGVRVVELATVVAAPSATRIMADMGAEVVKIEEPKVSTFRATSV